MSDAFRCDCCDEFYSGVPAVEVDLTGRSWSQGGETFLQPTHAAGHDDPVPNFKPQREIKWPWQKHSWALCADCFLNHVAEGLKRAIRNGRYADD